jgi:hypothetical protein
MSSFRVQQIEAIGISDYDFSLTISGQGCDPGTVQAVGCGISSERRSIVTEQTTPVCAEPDIPVFVFGDRVDCFYRYTTGFGK